MIIEYYILIYYTWVLKDKILEKLIKCFSNCIEIIMLSTIYSYNLFGLTK